MFQVKLGRHLLTEEKVAIKVLEKDKMTDSMDMERVEYVIRLSFCVFLIVILQKQT